MIYKLFFTIILHFSIKISWEAKLYKGYYAYKL